MLSIILLQLAEIERNEGGIGETSLSSTKAFLIIWKPPALFRANIKIMIENLPFVFLELEQMYAMVAFRIHIEKIAN